MVFIEIPIGGRAAILYCDGSTVRVIGDGNYAINVYRRVQNASGYGVAAFDSGANLTFKAGVNMLNVQGVGSMGIGGSFSGVGSAVSYPALASVTEVSTSTEWVLYQSWIQQDLVTFYECHTENQCNWDGYTNTFTCGPVTVCGYQSQWIQTLVFIYALVKKTTWTVKRAVARRTGASTYQQEFEAHSSGYYKEVIDIAAGSGTLNPTFGSLPPGYIPPPIFFDRNSLFTGASGYYTMDNKFPYSNGQSASISATIMTR
jgi:hypothetical protein